MNGEQLQYIRHTIGYFGVVLAAYILITTGFLLAPENASIAFAMAFAAIVLVSYSFGLYRDGINRWVWGQFTEWDTDSLTERAKRLESDPLPDGGEEE